MIMSLEGIRVNGDLNILVININLSIFIICKNSPSKINIVSNPISYLFYIFVKPFFKEFYP